MKLSPSQVIRLEDGASTGNARMQWFAGYVYLEGNGVVPDPAKAFRWFEKAAEQGYVLAQDRLRTMYEKGIGIQPNYEQAAKWAMKAAEAGHLWSQASLGAYYWSGKGVSRDLPMAFVWLTLAKEYGLRNLVSRWLLYRVTKQLKMEQIHSAERYIFKWETERMRKLAVGLPASSN